MLQPTTGETTITRQKLNQIQQSKHTPLTKKYR